MGTRSAPSMSTRCMKQEVVVWWGDTILDHFHYSGDRRLLPEGAVVLGLAPWIDLAIERRLDWDYPRTFAVSALAHLFFVVSSILTPSKQLFTSEGLRRSLPIISSVKLTKPAPKPAAAAYQGVEGTIGRRDRSRTRPAPMKHADP